MTPSKRNDLRIASRIQRGNRVRITTIRSRIQILSLPLYRKFRFNNNSLMLRAIHIWMCHRKARVYLLSILNNLNRWRGLRQPHILNLLSRQSSSNLQSRKSSKIALSKPWKKSWKLKYHCSTILSLTQISRLLKLKLPKSLSQYILYNPEKHCNSTIIIFLITKRPRSSTIMRSII